MSIQTNPAVEAAKATAINAEKATNYVIASSSMFKRFESLSIKREVWESNELAHSNDALYQIFDGCLELYRDLTRGEGVKAQKKGFEDFINIKGYCFKSTSPLTLKVIRCVFGEKDRRRLSTYHSVLRVAIADNWKVGEAAQRISEYGGVQEISLRRKDALTAKDKATIAREALMSESIATLKSKAISKKFDTSKIGESAVAVMTLESNGSYSVHCVVSSNTAVNAALTAYFSSNKADFIEAQKQKARELEEVTKTMLIKSAANDAQAIEAA
jgi:hypothetical protein